MRTEFYKKVLPAQGVYCVAGIDKNKKITNQFAETLSDVLAIVDRLEGEEQNVFVAPNSFSGHSRKADYAAFAKSFFIDLDTGEGKKYASKSDALLALMGFCEWLDLPPPVIIDSGGGVHAYWILDRDVPVEEWKPYAEKFKAVCLSNDLHIDPVVTADATRIMRCPETVNYKREPYVRSEFITEEIYEYDFDVFKEFLGPVVPTVQNILSQIPKGLDEDTKALLKLDNFQTTFQSIAERSLEGDGCNQIKYVLTHAATLPEPLWHSGLSIARHCEDWETAIHLMSEDYPGYSADHTLRKANETLNKPHSCIVIESRNPGGCDGCPHRGKITNPLALGRRLKQAAPQETPPDPVRVAQDPQAIPDFPQFIYPFVRGVNGGIYYVPPEEEGDEDGKKVKSDPIMLSPHVFFPFRRTFNKTEGECYEIRIIMAHEVREVVLPTKALSKLEEFKGVLGTQGIVPADQKLWPLIVYYMTKWIMYFQSQGAAELTRMQMGWTEAYDAFVIGETEVTKTGDLVRSAASPLVRGISKHLKPVGSYDLWRQAANKLNTPGLEMYAYGMLNSFGSPLMRFTSTSGVTVCYVGDSGAGKTGMLYAGLSVFGAPKELSVHEATDNALLMRALNLKNIMLGVDEIGNRPGEELSKLIHAISQGKAKARMQSSIDAERETLMTASMICSMTTNHSVIEKLKMIKANPNGEVARLIEFELRLPKLLADRPELGPEIFDTMRTNYGHAGPEYIQYLMRVGDGYIKKLIEYWHKRFVEAFGTTTAYRFWENGIASAFAGGQLANEAKIVEFDLERIFNYIVMEMIKLREGTAKINDVDYPELVTEYINKNWHNILMLDKGRVINEPRASIMGRIELDQELFMVPKTDFRKFLAEKTSGLREFETGMRLAGHRVVANKARLSSGWKSGMGASAPISVYEIKTTIPKMKLEDERASRRA
jgi:hypothetical protein